VTASDKGPEIPGSFPEAVLAALVDVAFQDGRHELVRSTGQRGVLRLHIELILGDHGVPVSSTTSLSFENKRHVKDGFSREKPHG
jgi:hypothetical protein